MSWLRAALGELFALFVDDVGFTLVLLAWVLLATLALPRLGLPPRWDAPVLALGCAALLPAGALQAGLRRRRGGH